MERQHLELLLRIDERLKSGMQQIDERFTHQTNWQAEHMRRCHEELNQLKRDVIYLARQFYGCGIGLAVLIFLIKLLWK